MRVWSGAQAETRCEGVVCSWCIYGVDMIWWNMRERSAAQGQDTHARKSLGVCVYSYMNVINHLVCPTLLL